MDDATPCIDAVIFWDIENIHVPRGSVGQDGVNRLIQRMRDLVEVVARQMLTTSLNPDTATQIDESHETTILSRSPLRSRSPSPLPAPSNPLPSSSVSPSVSASTTPSSAWLTTPPPTASPPLCKIHSIIVVDDQHVATQDREVGTYLANAGVTFRRVPRLGNKSLYYKPKPQAADIQLIVEIFQWTHRV
ncbi:hypothetical protein CAUPRSCDRAFT_12630 [Caulochytrium protostelioides]|nr:hypothetical protein CAUPRSCDRAFT_12630 [Caulochytrium protostelioides]